MGADEHSAIDDGELQRINDLVINVRKMLDRCAFTLTFAVS